jgi:hypothetical protein
MTTKNHNNNNKKQQKQQKQRQKKSYFSVSFQRNSVSNVSAVITLVSIVPPRSFCRVLVAVLIGVIVFLFLDEDINWFVTRK